MAIKAHRRLGPALSTTLAALALAGVAPAAQADSGSGSSCVPSGDVSQPFSPWLDRAPYVLSPGGDFEGALDGWSLGDASVADDNESFQVGSSSDSHALQLEDDAVTSAPLCIDLTFPTFRFFLRNVGNSGGRLRVDVQGTGPLGRGGLTYYLRGSDAWAPSPVLLLLANFDSLLSFNRRSAVTFRFRADGGSWRIDDLYVDPYRRG